MKKKQKMTIVVRCLDGSEHWFEFEQQFEGFYRQLAMTEALEMKHLLLGLKDRLIIIPVHSISSVEVIPPPSPLPKLAIKNAKLLKAKSPTKR